MNDPRRAGPGNRIKVNPSYLYQGSYGQNKSTPKLRRVAKVLFWAAAAIVGLGIVAVALGGAVDPTASAIETGLVILFIVAGICLWVAGGD